MQSISKLLTIKPKLTLLLLVSTLLTLPVQAGVLAWLGRGQAEESPPQIDFLPVEQAFVLSHHQAGNHLRLSFAIEPGYYLYRHTVAVSASNAQLGRVILPAGQPHEDQYFGNSQVYYQQLTLDVPLTAIEKNGELEVQYQGCTTDLCYAPQTVSIPLTMQDQR